MDDKAYIQALRGEPRRSELAFPRKEYEERVARLRQEMDARGLDALLIADSGNMFYVSGYYTFETSLHACVLLPRNGAPAIQVASLEVAIAVLKTWIDEILSFDRSKASGVSDQIVDWLKRSKLDKARIGIDARLPALRVALVRELETALPQASFPDASDIVFKLRVVKSPTEIEYLRKAADFTRIGIRAGLNAVAAGKTDNHVGAAAYAAMAEAGSEFMSAQPIVAVGHRSGWAHTHFLRVPMRAGDTVFLEFGGVYNRYTAPMMRTAHIGAPDDQVRRVTDAVKDCVERILAAVKPGRTAHDVAVEAGKGLKPVSDIAWHTGVYGYAVGGQFPPSWAERSAFIAEGSETVLQPNMVFHLPTCFRVPNRFGVGLSETLRVTETGVESLTESSRDLHIVPA
jgi:Xaa-Pro dipeptidase